MATEEEQKEASKQISDKIMAANRLIDEAEAIADKAGVSFHFSVGYGMGGEYQPKLTEEQRLEAERAGTWVPSEGEEGWQSSSSRC